MKSLGDLGALPTVMSIDNEIRVVDVLTHLDINYIREHGHEFLSRVTDLAISHTDGGIMELTATNQHIFFAFADWLERLASEVGFQIDPWETSVFRTSLEDLVERWGSPNNQN